MIDERPRALERGLDDIRGRHAKEPAARTRFARHSTLLAGQWLFLLGFGVVVVGSATMTAKATCPPDLTGDSSVGPADLAQVLGSWGFCPDCNPDFNGDNFVGAFDLAQVLGSWGPCPSDSLCGNPDTGDCCLPHGAIGCNDESCCSAVCEIDAFCCDVAWDGICASEAAQLCTLCSICGDGVLQPGEQCDPPDGFVCSADCQLMDCNFVDVRTLVSGSEFDPPEVQRNYDVLNRTNHLLEDIGFANLFWMPLEQLHPELVNRALTLELCTGVPTDVPGVIAALDSIAGSSGGLSLADVVLAPPGVLNELKSALDSLRMHGIGLPPVALSDAQAIDRLPVLVNLIEQVGMLTFRDLFFVAHDQVSEAQLIAIEQARGESGILSFESMDENGIYFGTIPNKRCCKKKVCQPGVLDFDECRDDTKACYIPGSTDNCGYCSVGSDNC